MPKPLPLSFFSRPSEIVAPELLGCVLSVVQRPSARAPQRSTAPAPQRLSAYITEVEAYLGVADPASHVWKGRNTPTVRHLYSPPGTWYVYKSHGLHWCCNLTAKGKNAGHAVLLRGVLAADEETLRRFRRRRGAKVAEKNLSDGPGKLTQALGIDLSLGGVTMAGSWAEVFEGNGALDGYETRVTPRIGLTRAVDWMMRWVVRW